MNDMFNHALALLPRVIELPPEQQAPTLWQLGPQLFGTRSWGPQPDRVVLTLAELLENASFTTRALAIRLIAEVVTGNHRTLLDCGLDLDQPDICQRFEQPEPRAAYRTALSLTPVLHEELFSAEPAVRAAAALVLAFLPGEAQASAARLRERLKVEEDTGVVCSLLLALGLTHRYAKLPWDVPEPAPSMPVEQRAAWFCGWSYATPSSGDAGPEIERAVALLGELASRPWCDREVVPFGQGHLDCLLAKVVARRNPRALEAMSHTLANAVVGLGKLQEPADRAAEWAVTALNLLWPKEKNLPRTSAALSPLARGILSKLSEYDTPAPFHGFGLPSGCWERRRWLGLAPATAFELELEDEDGQMRSVPALLMRWDDDGRKGKAYEYLRERLSLHQFAEVVGEASEGAGYLSSPPDEVLPQCLAELSAKDAEWAEQYAGQLWGRLEFDTRVPERQRIGVDACLLVLIPYTENLPEGTLLPARWARLMRLGSHDCVAPCRRLLTRLSPEQREKLFASYLEEDEGFNVTLMLLSPYLDFFPSLSLLARYLELASLAAQCRNRRRVLVARDALQALATSSHPLAGEVAQRLENWSEAYRSDLEAMNL